MSINPKINVHNYVVNFFCSLHIFFYLFRRKPFLNSKGFCKSFLCFLCFMKYQLSFWSISYFVWQTDEEIINIFSTFIIYWFITNSIQNFLKKRFPYFFLYSFISLFCFCLFPIPVTFLWQEVKQMISVLLATPFQLLWYEIHFSLHDCQMFCVHSCSFSTIRVEANDVSPSLHGHQMFCVMDLF